MAPLSRPITRRAFLIASAAFAVRSSAQTRRLETLTDWLNASPGDRRRALGPLLKHVKSIEESVDAWVEVEPQRVTGKGSLQGVPFGVKDIIEVRGLALEYGSPLYKGQRGTVDAGIVKRLRERGGLVLGKTHTAAFAYRTPAPTRNPRNLAHTPGGSSSGSAAAVAAGMVPLAIGTQTGGSMLRPASYCGVTGFKTSYGLLPLDGVLEFAKSLDTLGFFTHTAADMLAFWEAFGMDAGKPEELPMAAVDPLTKTEPPMARAYTAAISRLRAGGVSIRTIDIRQMLGQLHEAQQLVMFYEGARIHGARFAEYGDRLDDVAALVRKGREISNARYEEALAFVAESRSRVSKFYEETPIILVPAATGPAPSGLSYTGDSSMNSPWTALGTPAISIPMPVGSELPLGLQLTARHGDDARLLQSAVRVERLLGQERGSGRGR